LIWISLIMGIPIIRTYSEDDTAQFIFLIAQRLSREKSGNSLNRIKMRGLTLFERQVSLLSSIKGIGPTLSQNLINKFQSIESIVYATENDLTGIPGIGVAKAKNIKSIICKNYDKPGS
jgi:ERCC4-type nuclease